MIVEQFRNICTIERRNVKDDDDDDVASALKDYRWNFMNINDVDY